jgi:hypothetical protein
MVAETQGSRARIPILCDGSFVGVLARAARNHRCVVGATTKNGGMNHHPDAVVARILSANNNNVIARADLAELSLVCGRLSGDLSSLMPLLATVIQRALRVNIMTDVKDLYQDKSPSEVAKILDQVCRLFAVCMIRRRRGGIVMAPAVQHRSSPAGRKLRVRHIRSSLVDAIVIGRCILILFMV